MQKLKKSYYWQKNIKIISTLASPGVDTLSLTFESKTLFHHAMEASTIKLLLKIAYFYCKSSQ
jgi:hypothetical protein